MNFKNLFTLLFLFVGLTSVTAQDECDCPDTDWDTEGICIEVEQDGEANTGWVPDECYAECFFGEDFTIVECEEWEWEDECECPEEDWTTDGICVDVVDGGESYNTWVPSECYAACWYEEYTIAECEEWEWEDECECPEEDWTTDGICVDVVDGGESYNTWVPSECYAACWFEEYTIAECEEWEWEDECECPEEDWNSEGICVEVVEGAALYNTWVPSECYAACWFEEYTIAECEEWEWEDECDCPEEDWNAEGICVDVNYDGELFTEWAPSTCYADCWYEDYTVVECLDGGFGNGGGDFDWDVDCDCEIDSDEGICIIYVYSDSVFGTIDTLVEWVPNECFADCWGFTDYSVIDCESIWDWEEEDTEIITTEGDSDCIIELLETEDLTFQTFLYGLADCEAIELGDCVLNAPIFDTDEDFIEYLVANCPEWFGLVMNESEGPSLFTRFQDAQDEAGVTSTTDIEGLQVTLLGNPVVDQLNVSIKTAEALNLQVVVTSGTGKVLNVDNVKLGKGEQLYQLNTDRLSAGIYNMTMSNHNAVQTIKFVVVK